MPALARWTVRAGRQHRDRTWSYYPALGGARAKLDDDRRIGDSFAHKTLWAVAARYRGPLLIRGRRLERNSFQTSPARWS